MNPSKIFERIAQKDHNCAYGCGCKIEAGDKIYEVTYVLNGHWYTEYYHYNCW